MKLARHCPNLRTVRLRGTQVGDAALAALAERCRAMETIDLESCLNITDAGVAALRGRGRARWVGGWVSE